MNFLCESRSVRFSTWNERISLRLGSYFTRRWPSKCCQLGVISIHRLGRLTFPDGSRTLLLGMMQLKDWLDLSLNKSLPSSLLILSRYVFMRSQSRWIDWIFYDLISILNLITRSFDPKPHFLVRMHCYVIIFYLNRRVKLRSFILWYNVGFCFLRAFMVSGRVRPEEAMQATLSSLPDQVVDSVSAATPGDDSLAERQRKLEYLREQEELIKVMIRTHCTNFGSLPVLCITLLSYTNCFL